MPKAASNISIIVSELKKVLTPEEIGLIKTNKDFVFEVFKPVPVTVKKNE